jgi:hypothetical protein
MLFHHYTAKQKQLEKEHATPQETQTQHSNLLKQQERQTQQEKGPKTLQERQRLPERGQQTLQERQLVFALHYYY